MKNTLSLANNCLIAMPSLDGSYFEKAVIYLLEHDEHGAFGLIINKPTDASIDDVLLQINPDYDGNSYPESVYLGGPVDTHRGFVLHRPSNTDTWEQQATLNEEVAITTSADILSAMSNEHGVGEYQIILGYSGWSEGQLEEELAENAWLAVKVPLEQLLKVPAKRRIEVALKPLGIHYNQLSSTSGKA